MIIHGKQKLKNGYKMMIIQVDMEKLNGYIMIPHMPIENFLMKLKKQIPV